MGRCHGNAARATGHCVPHTTFFHCRRNHQPLNLAQSSAALCHGRNAIIGPRNSKRGWATRPAPEWGAPLRADRTPVPKFAPELQINPSSPSDPVAALLNPVSVGDWTEGTRHHDAPRNVSAGNGRDPPRLPSANAAVAAGLLRMRAQ